MLQSLRTYRLLHFVVAAAVVLSVTLPLVRYACAMNDTSLMSPSAALAGCAEQDTDMRSDDCSLRTSMLCPKDSPCSSPEKCTSPSGGEPSCCTEETVQAENARVLEFKPTLVYVVLPVLALLTAPERVPTPASNPSLAHELHGDAGGGVPVRVLHACFLL